MQHDHAHADGDHDHAHDTFSTYMEDGRIWVFETGSKAHDSFLSVGEPAKSVTILGAGLR